MLAVAAITAGALGAAAGGALAVTGIGSSRLAGAGAIWAAACAGPDRPATRFAVAWWTQDWRDPPGAAARRVASLVTPALERELQGALPAPALVEAERAAQRRVRAGTPVVVLADRSGRGLGLAVSAPIEVTTRRGGPVATWEAMEVLVVPARGCWLVAEVDQ